MRQYFILYLLFLGMVSGCQKSNKYAKQIATADGLIHALHAYDTAKISSMTGVNPENIGEDKEHYEFKMEAAKKMLQKAGIPNIDDFTIKEYPNNSADLIDVIAPLKSSGQSITVRFVKFLPANKIAFFQLDGPISIKSTIGTPPSKN